MSLPNCAPASAPLARPPNRNTAKRNVTHEQKRNLPALLPAFGCIGRCWFIRWARTIKLQSRGPVDSRNFFFAQLPTETLAERHWRQEFSETQSGACLFR